MSRIILIVMFIFMSFTLKNDYSQIGRASFYSNKFEGRKTSSGEVFKQKLMTGAHKTLAFGTLVKVTNLQNDSTVVLKINDRLSKSSSSLIDVTLSAARQLNFVRNGHAQVRVEQVK